VSGDAIDQQPSSALPLPVRRGGRFLREAVIDTEGAADDEQAVGNFVNCTKGKFLEMSVE